MPVTRKMCPCRYVPSLSRRSYDICQHQPRSGSVNQTIFTYQLASRPWWNTKILSYQYRISHRGDQMVISLISTMGFPVLVYKWISLYINWIKTVFIKLFSKLHTLSTKCSKLSIHCWSLIRNIFCFWHKLEFMKDDNCLYILKYFCLVVNDNLAWFAYAAFSLSTTSQVLRYVSSVNHDHKCLVARSSQCSLIWRGIFLRWLPSWFFWKW